MIVVLCGPPGAGKTTVARGLEERLADEFPDDRAYRFDSDAFASRTYERLAERVAEVTVDDASSGGDDAAAPMVVVAGTFYRRAWRERFRGLPDRNRAEGIRFVRLEASLESCLERNRARADADAIGQQGVHVVYREFEPFGEGGEPAADLRLDTDGLSVAEIVDRIAAAVEAWRDEGGDGNG